MRRCAAGALLAALLLAGAGCSAPSREEGPSLWYAGDMSQWQDDSVAVGKVSYAGEMEVDALLDALLSGGGDRSVLAENGLRSPFPAGLAVLGWRLEGGLLRLDLSAAYGALEGFELTLANYCLALTLTQLECVDRVSVTVEGRPPRGSWWKELDPGQALLSGAEERQVEVSAGMFFPRAAGRGLGVETRTFLLTEGDVLAEEVMGALLSGPVDVELSSAIPEGTELRSLRLEDGVCYVNFSQALLDGLPADRDSQTLLIYSIVNTLGNLGSVSSVCLQVEGETLTRLGQVELPAPLEPDFGLVGN